MAKIHLNPQHKGGVGKTYLAFLLAQYFLETEQSPVCIDTDPLNQTFTGFKRFNAEWINICDNHNRFDESRFDALMEKLLSGAEDDIFVIDCGTSTFVPLCSYMAESNALSMLIESGHEVFLHSVIAGSDLLSETIHGLKDIIEAFPGIPVCVWLNEFWGLIGNEKISFEDMPIYKEHRERIKAIIRIPELKAQTFGKDIKQMTVKQLTFSEAIASEKFKVMSKQRLTMAWRDIQLQLDAIPF